MAPRPHTPVRPTTPDEVLPAPRPVRLLVRAGEWAVGVVAVVGIFSCCLSASTYAALWYQAAPQPHGDQTASLQDHTRIGYVRPAARDVLRTLVVVTWVSFAVVGLGSWGLQALRNRLRRRRAADPPAKPSGVLSTDAARRSSASAGVDPPGSRSA